MKPFSGILMLFIALFLVLQQTTCYSNSIHHQKLHEFQRHIHEKTSLDSPVDPNPRKRSGRIFYPMGYGADPRGERDSSEAIMSALGDAIKLAETGADSFLTSGIRDLGGVVINLQGGSYKISNPISFPSRIANVLVEGGSLRASNTFPGDRHLIELWAPNSQPLDKKTTDLHHDSKSSFYDKKDQNSQIYYEGITFRDVLFDSGYRGGGIKVIDSLRVRINNCFFIHFSTQGILVERGHETFISSCFLGQHSTAGGDRGERGFSGTAIDLASNDNAVTDVAIFSAATGIILRGQANIITGVHCYNKATYFGGVGILVQAAKTRIDNCYLDFNGIVIEDPHQVHVSNGFFLGDGNIVLKSIKGEISGLNIVNNMFSGDPGKMVPIISLHGPFMNVDQVVIDHNNVDGMRLKSTVGKSSVRGNGTKWVVDFSSVLVFPNRINHVYYSFFVQGGLGFPTHALTSVSSNAVVVESDRAVDAVVSVAVDQNNMVGERNYFFM